MTWRDTPVRHAGERLAILALVTALAGCGPSLSPVEPLAALAPIALTGQGKVAIPLTSAGDQHLMIRVSGQAIDVRVSLIDANGTTLARVDAPGRATGTEILLAESDAAVPLSLLVTGNDYATVHGQVFIAANRLPDRTDDDRDRIAAARLEMNASLVRDTAVADSARAVARDFAAAAELYRNLEDTVGMARARLHEAWVLGWDAWDYEASVRAADVALEIARREGLPEIEAHALMCGGAARTSLAQGLAGQEAVRAAATYDAARQSLADAATVYARLELPALEALALSYGGVAEHYSGHWDAAERKYAAASDRWLAIDDTAHHTLALQSLALLMHDRGDPRQSIEYFDRALEWAENVPRIDYAYMLYNSALPHQVLGAFDEAIERYHNAMQILAEAGERPAEARALHGIGAVLKASGETERARDVLNAVVAMRPPGSDDRARAYALMLLGDVAVDLGNTDEALALHLEALSLTQSPNDEIRARVSLASTLLAAKQPEAARTHLDAALALALPETHQIRARAWRELGVVRSALGHTGAADAAFAEALRLFAATGADLELAFVLEARARAAFDAGDFERVAQDTAAAREILTRTSSLGIHADQRAVFLASRRSTLKMQIDALLALAATARRDGAPARAEALQRQAFEASDRSRSVLLLDALATRGSDVPHDLLERRGLLLEQLAGKRARRDTLLGQPEQDTSAIERLSGEIIRTRSELDSIAGRIGEHARVNRGSRGAAPVALTLTPPPRTAVAEYLVAERSSWLFVSAGDRLTVHALPRRSDLDRMARALYQEWSSASGDPDDARDLLDELHDALLAPLEEATGTAPILLVPDGPLYLLPLASLAQMTDGTLRGREITTIPSLLALTAVEHDRAPAPRILAMIADPVFEADDPRLGGDRRVRVGRSADGANAMAITRSARSLDELQRLPAAAIEARDILALVPEEDRLALLGLDANRDAVLAANLADYRILHFATHAWADSVDPALATLAFSTTDRHGHALEGALRAADLAALDLRADLVVLSGCETALGREIDGEGLVGLSHAFLRAGAHTVVASLWQVPDTSTAVLMREFYRALLEEHQTPPQALLHAQRQVRSQPRWADPYYWAGFQVVSVAPAGPHHSQGE